MSKTITVEFQPRWMSADECSWSTWAFTGTRADIERECQEHADEQGFEVAAVNESNGVVVATATPADWS